MKIFIKMSGKIYLYLQIRRNKGRKYQTSVYGIEGEGLSTEPVDKQQSNKRAIQWF